MSSNVGAGDTIGTMLISHGIDMYSVDGTIPLTPIKNFHLSGMLISIEKNSDGYILSAKKAEKENGVITVDNGGELIKVFIKDGEQIKL